jgi:hypothetical protein
VVLFVENKGVLGDPEVTDPSLFLARSVQYHWQLVRTMDQNDF